MTVTLRPSVTGCIMLGVMLSISACATGVDAISKPLSAEEIQAINERISAGPTGDVALNSRHANREKQVEWAVTEAETALNIMGQHEGWLHLQRSDPHWASTHDRDPAEYSFGSCMLPELDPWGLRLADPGAQGGQLHLTLINNSFSDTFDAAKRLLDAWHEAGWEIAESTTEAEEENQRTMFVRADEPGGSMLVLKADDTSIVFEINPACSSSIVP